MQYFKKKQKKKRHPQKSRNRDDCVLSYLIFLYRYVLRNIFTSAFKYFRTYNCSLTSEGREEAVCFFIRNSFLNLLYYRHIIEEQSVSLSGVYELWNRWLQFGFFVPFHRQQIQKHKVCIENCNRSFRCELCGPFKRLLIINNKWLWRMVTLTSWIWKHKGEKIMSLPEFSENREIQRSIIEWYFAF